MKRRLFYNTRPSGPTWTIGESNSRERFAVTSHDKAFARMWTSCIGEDSGIYSAAHVQKSVGHDVAGLYTVRWLIRFDILDTLIEKIENIVRLGSNANPYPTAREKWWLRKLAEQFRALQAERKLAEA